MIEIELLKRELQNKINELNECLENQQRLKASLKSASTALEDIKSQLKGLEAFVEYTNEYIYRLQLENQMLELSRDEWIKRAIDLEFKVPSARDVED